MQTALPFRSIPSVAVGRMPGTVRLPLCDASRETCGAVAHGLARPGLEKARPVLKEAAMRRKDPVEGSRAMRIGPSRPAPPVWDAPVWDAPVWDASRGLPSLWRDALDSWLGTAPPRVRDMRRAA